MRYIITLFSLFCFSLTINAQNIPTQSKTERSEITMTQQAYKMSIAAIEKSLERYDEAVLISDVNSQGELRNQMLELMTLAVSKLKEQPTEKKKLNIQKKILVNSKQNSNPMQFKELVSEFLKNT